MKDGSVRGKSRKEKDNPFKDNVRHYRNKKLHFKAKQRIRFILSISKCSL